MASWAPRTMSVPVDDCEPLIGPSTAIVPAVGDAVVELDDEQLDAPTAVTANATTTGATRIGLRLRLEPPVQPTAPSCQPGDNAVEYWIAIAVWLASARSPPE